jgi:phospholipid/cholesterol/gamma-HCH transport system substrate-binding protein
MEPRVHYVIVGLFVLLLGTATVGFSLWLAFGDTAYETQTYRIYMSESVAGLFVDAPVKYRGVQIGRVRELGIDPDNPDRVRVTVAIDAAVRIKEDTLATLAVQGVTGIASIDLSGGSRESPELKPPPGEPYPVIQSGQSLFTRVDAAVSELIGNLNMVAHDLHALLTPQTRERVTRTLANVDELTTTLAEQRAALGEGIAAFAEFSHNAADASAQLPELLTRVDTAVTSLQGLADDVTLATRDVRMQIDAGGDSLKTLGGRTLPEVDSLLAEMRQLTASFQRLSDRLEEDPRAILYGPQLDPPGPGE